MTNLEESVERTLLNVHEAVAGASDVPVHGTGLRAHIHGALSVAEVLGAVQANLLHYIEVLDKRRRVATLVGYRQALADDFPPDLRERFEQVVVLAVRTCELPDLPANVSSHPGLAYAFAILEDGTIITSNEPLTGGRHHNPWALPEV